jgi:hypothetical protein
MATLPEVHHQGENNNTCTNRREKMAMREAGERYFPQYASPIDL